ILNLTDKAAHDTKNGMINILKTKPAHILNELKTLRMPTHHDVRAEDVNLKRLGSVLAMAQNMEVNDIETLLLLDGAGPRTIQSLTLVSEIIHGTASRFDDPARFSFAHGGKDGHPFPVPLKVYDESIQQLETAVQKAKLGFTEKNLALKNLSKVAIQMESTFKPNNRFNDLVQKERDDSWKYGGMTIKGPATKKTKQKAFVNKSQSQQLTLNFP